MIRAAAYDADGKPVGYPTGEVFYYEEKLEPNLATGKSVTVSGGTQSPQNPEFAVDGKADNPHDSWWAGPAPQWLQVDLGQVYQVDRVRVYPYWDGCIITNTPLMCRQTESNGRRSLTAARTRHPRLPKEMMSGFPRHGRVSSA